MLWESQKLSLRFWLPHAPSVTLTNRKTYDLTTQEYLSPTDLFTECHWRKDRVIQPLAKQRLSTFMVNSLAMVIIPALLLTNLNPSCSLSLEVRNRNRHHLHQQHCHSRHRSHLHHKHDWANQSADLLIYKPLPFLKVSDAWVLEGHILQKDSCPKKHHRLKNPFLKVSDWG